MFTSRVTTSHTKKYEVTHFAKYSLVWFCDLGRISSVGLAQAFMIATLILSLRLRIAEAGHLVVIRQNLSGGKAVPLQYICFFFNFANAELLKINNVEIWLKFETLSAAAITDFALLAPNVLARGCCCCWSCRCSCWETCTATALAATTTATTKIGSILRGLRQWWLLLCVCVSRVAKGCEGDKTRGMLPRQPDTRGSLSVSAEASPGRCRLAQVETTPCMRQ